MVDWHHLTHAYGPADNVPELIRQLTPDDESCVWNELWSCLCHQDTVYSASFAALPALAEVAQKWKPADRTQILLLAGAILASTDVRNGWREQLLRPVEWVVPVFQRLCRESLAETGLNKDEFIHLLQADCFFEGDRNWTARITHLADGEFPGVCPHCRVDLYLVIGEAGFFTTAEEWLRRPPQVPGAVERRSDVKYVAIEPGQGVLPEAGRRMLDYAIAAHQNDVAALIRYVFGNTGCPSCSRSFSVLSAIISE